MATLSEQLVALVAGLSQLTISLPQINIELPILDILHAILINYTYRSALRESHAKIGWGQGLLATIVMAAGGGSTVAVLLGEPLGILKNNNFWGIYGATYWLMFSNPYVYQFFQYFFSVPAVEQLVTIADGILRTSAVINVGVEAVATHPQLGADKFVAKVLCGTLAGSAGGLWIDAFRLSHEQWSFSTPRILTAPSLDMKACFLTSVFYLSATTPGVLPILGLPELTPLEAQAWSTAILSSALVYKSCINRWCTEQVEAAREKKDQ